MLKPPKSATNVNDRCTVVNDAISYYNRAHRKRARQNNEDEHGDQVPNICDTFGARAINSHDVYSKEIDLFA
jgi:hypothetical protein